MKTYVKPNGTQIELNDCPDTVAMAKEMGWKAAKGGEKAPTVAPNADARGLPWDERLNTKNKSMDKDGNWKYKKGMTTEKAVVVEGELYAALPVD